MNSDGHCKIFSIDRLIPGVDIAAFYAAILNGIAVYSNCSTRLTSISLSCTKLLVNKVIEARVKRAQQLIQCYFAAGLTPFEPVVIRKSRSRFKIVSPPVFEATGEYLVMDGSHRIFAANKTGLNAVIALEIYGLKFPPPASEAFSCDQVDMVQYVDHWTQRTVNFQPQLFRPVPMVLDQLSEKYFRALADEDAM